MTVEEHRDIFVNCGSSVFECVVDVDGLKDSVYWSRVQYMRILARKFGGEQEI